MIGGLFMIFAAIWVYQSAARAKIANPFLWVAIAAAGFFAVQFLLVEFDIFLLESSRSSEGGENYEAVNGADRKNEGDFEGFGGILKSLFFELAPPIIGLVAVAFLRACAMLKLAPTVPNLTGGLKEIFVGIKESFQSAAKDQ